MASASAAASTEDTTKPATLSKEDEDRLTQLQQASGGFQNAFNTKLKAAQRSLNAAERATNISSLTIAKLEKANDALETAWHKLEDCLLTAATILEGQSDKAAKNKVLERIETHQTEYLDASDRMSAIMDGQSPAHRQPQQPPQAAAGERRDQNATTRQRRIDDSLRPETLTLEHKPDEYREWQAGFRAWYDINNMEEMSRALQQRLLYKVLSQQLRAHLTNNINEHTPIFRTRGAGEACITLIDNEFERCYPLTQKRVMYFRARHERGQQFTEFMTGVQRLGTEADVAAMGPDETHAFVAIVACNDDKLRERLLRLKDINTTNIMAEARAYEAERAVEQAIDQPQVRAISSTQGERRYPQNGCRRCNSTTHDTENCRVPSDTVCHQCGRRGHLMRACEQGGHRTEPGRRDRDNSRRRSRPTERRYSNWGSRDPTPHRDPSWGSRGATPRRHSGRRSRDGTPTRSQSPRRRIASPRPYGRARIVGPGNTTTGDNPKEDKRRDTQDESEEQDFY